MLEDFSILINFFSEKLAPINSSVFTEPDYYLRTLNARVHNSHPTYIPYYRNIAHTSLTTLAELYCRNRNHTVSIINN